MKKILLTMTLIFTSTKGLVGQDSFGYIKIYGHDKSTKSAILDSFIVNLIDKNNKSTVYKLKPDSDGYVGIKYLTADKYIVSLSVSGYQTLKYNKIIVDGIHTSWLSFPLTSLSDAKTKKRKRNKN